MEYKSINSVINPKLLFLQPDLTYKIKAGWRSRGVRYSKMLFSFHLPPTRLKKFFKINKSKAI